MADQPYTPAEEQVRDLYIGRWGTHDRGRAVEQFDRFIEAVKRDAAREALDGLAAEVRLEWHERHHWVLQPIDDYRNDSYPETEDQT